MLNVIYQLFCYTTVILCLRCYCFSSLVCSFFQVFFYLGYMFFQSTSQPPPPYCSIFVLFYSLTTFYPSLLFFFFFLLKKPFLFIYYDYVILFFFFFLSLLFLMQELLSEFTRESYRIFIHFPFCPIILKPFLFTLFSTTNGLKQDIFKHNLLPKKERFLIIERVIV